ncbi:MAG: GNAT family N-acetyltransferase [Gemmatimonadota bacterium]
MTIRRPDPREEPAARANDPLALAVWIRPYRDDDQTAVRGLVYRILDEFGLVADHVGRDADLEDIERHYRLHGGEFWVVENARGEIVGSGGVMFDPDDPTLSLLHKMYLDGSLRGRGLGRQLLGLALDHARRAGRTRMELETASVLTAAIGLYEHNGFVEMDARPSGRCDRRFGMNLQQENTA